MVTNLEDTRTHTHTGSGTLVAVTHYVNHSHFKVNNITVTIKITFFTSNCPGNYILASMCTVYRYTACTVYTVCIQKINPVLLHATLSLWIVIVLDALLTAPCNNEVNNTQQSNSTLALERHECDHYYPEAPWQPNDKTALLLAPAWSHARDCETAVQYVCVWLI